MGILSGNPKDEPLHYGEAMAVWTSSLTAKSMIAGYSTLINHAGDQDLKKLIEEAIKMGKSEMTELDQVLKENGIALPPAPPERPEAKLDDIPAGARFQDPEIAANLSRDVATGLSACSMAMGQSIREDIGAMFAKFHAEKARLGGECLRLNKEKGWLVPPPLLHDPVEKK
ncbi:DUF3231 family protein [Domibacillus epiphyticus]|uniref:DUF3231 domain-containing protein n=1 Tax=Domibacillus epiphyticus TaxID=1714355 RepID=A0A1V2A628_9BACI|nr:DUF3231 family protein [Domibacillus epiphyticus]OMP66469.1 hypothetical protein BTO28_12270 [Domibacillus epiphyticus]